MQRPVSTLALSAAVKLKLGAAGFQFTADLLGLTPPQLSRESVLSLEEAAEVLQAARRDEGGGGAVSLTALELLQKEEELRSVITFSSQLDTALGGGVPVGKTTEICGVPGIGKTQLCLQLAVDVQVPQCFGGIEGQAMFIDTEGSFVVERVIDIATAAVNHCSLLVEDDEQKAAMTTFTLESILSNIFVVRCHDYVELLAELHLLPSFLMDRPNIRLLVIDSVTFPFRQQFDDLSQRTRLLNSLGQQLISMATSHHIAVMITNQMTTKLRGSQSQLVPALGESWGHTATIRILLHWEGSRRLATLVKSPAHMEKTVQYEITAEGFRDVDQLDLLQSKRLQMDADPKDSSR
ncbi:DNA repair protein RAD51 homolog 3 [Pholidichthys leucotaenia]